jgi:5-methylcytosine-specific restriction endonuclease McrA
MASDVRSAFHHDDRIRLSGQQTAKLFLERGGRCHRCKRRLGPADDWIVEHMLALENGGKNEWDNYDITCGWCKPKKDTEDHGKAAKSRHVATKHVLPKDLRKPKGRSFQKAPDGYSTFSRTWKDSE